MYRLREKIISLQKQGKKIVRLDIGEAEPQCGDWIAEVVRECVAKGIRYGSAKGNSNLVSKICASHNVGPENVAIGPGSKFIIYALLKILGREVVNVEPAWPAYKYMAGDLHLGYHPIKTTFESGWQPSPEDFSSISSKTIVLNSPSNPTSVSIHKLNEIIKTASGSGNFIMLDLAYADLSFKKFETPEFSGNMAMLYTMSKLYGLSGWRVGYAILPKWIKEKYDDFVSITINNVPEVAQEVAARSFGRNNSETLKKYHGISEHAHSVFSKAGFASVKPEAGFYLFVDVGDGDKVAMELLDHGFAVMPGRVFGDGYNKFIRIALPEKREIMDEVAEKLLALK